MEAIRYIYGIIWHIYIYIYCICIYIYIHAISYAHTYVYHICMIRLVNLKQ